ncbi:MAG: ion transporter [Bacteroidales bacterium]|nr:ion transporter [Bacteroidales bacterium]
MNKSAKIKSRLYDIIFGTKSFAGKTFDLILLLVILFSIIAVMLETVPRFSLKYHTFFRISEWIITGLFTVEYVLRIWILKKPFRYIFSFFGFIDLLSLLPTYLGLFFAVKHSLVIIRSLRFIRIFRILNLPSYSLAGNLIWQSLKDSRQKIVVFLVAVVTIVFVVGTLMYMIEGPENGFTSIPESAYWAVVTVTTVGYGDIAPQTNAGKLLSTFLMLIGYAVIAVPTGIVTSSLIRNTGSGKKKICPSCHCENDENATYCKQCGNLLEKNIPDNG